MKQIPNLFTLLNLVFGCLAIVVALQNGIMIIKAEDGTEELVQLPEKIWMASLFIGLAAVVDFLDGFLARLLGADSAMGKQLDSLADIVSFGVAPSVILYQFLRLGYAAEPDGIETSIGYLVPSFLFAAAGAWRLARYNIDTTQTNSFRGVPIPAAGLMVASFPLIYWYSSHDWARELLLNVYFIYGIIVILSLLMVSRLPMLAFKFRSTKIADLLPLIIIAAVGVASAIFLQWLAVPVTFLAYVLISLLFKNKFA